MKKISTTMFLGLMLLFGMHAFGQTAEVPFSVSSHDTALMTEQNGIKVSYIKGTLNAIPSVYFMFKNNTTKTENFSWVLKDKNGEVVYTSKSLHIDGGQTIDYDDNENNIVSVTGITDFLFFLKDGVNFTELKMEINQ
jgi:hypothetical protein